MRTFTCGVFVRYIECIIIGVNSKITHMLPNWTKVSNMLHTDRCVGSKHHIIHICLYIIRVYSVFVPCLHTPVKFWRVLALNSAI